MAVVEVTERDVKKILGETNISTFQSFEIVSLCDDKVIGFLADHFILRVATDSGVFEFFLKAVPRYVEKRREYIEETGFFKREANIYKHFIPKLEQFSSFFWASKCFLVKENHFIVLEYLKDYQNVNSQQLLLGYEHFKIASKYLASLHASSIIYEHKVAKFSEIDLKMLEENAYLKESHRTRAIGFERGIQILTQLIKLIPKYEKLPNLQEIQKEFSQTCRKLLQFVETSKKYINCLNHADLWSNNIMFKYDEENKPIAVKLVDFQLTRYAPPAMDLATFMHSCSTREFRRLHEREILINYCDAIENELNHHGLNVLSRVEIFKSYEEYRLAGLIEASLFCHLILLPDDLATNIMQSSEEYDKFISQCRAEKCFSAFKEEYYRERMTELLTELIDKFVIVNA